MEHISKRTKLDIGPDEWDSLKMLSGFNNMHATEALPDTLPIGQNSPQLVAHGLYAEQLSGTAFTCPRSTNQRTWAYRIAPSVAQGKYAPSASRAKPLVSEFTADASTVDPSPARWRPLPLPSTPTHFLDGLVTMAGAGGPATKEGLAIHLYACNAPMVDLAFMDADGDLLVVPQQGALRVTTELGRMHVAPGEICVVPRNVRFAVDPAPSAAAVGGCRGYVLEVFSGHFKLPELGPIGANGLAEPRDFEAPSAWFEDRACDFTVTTKLLGELYDVKRSHSCWDVVAWHGNYCPYKYDLSRFHAVNTVTVDHSDPSIFTVLTVPSHEAGVAVADFVIFPPRWMCAEHTFRPPYYHRNVMSEFMGLVGGTYDAKAGGKDGFVAGGSSLHGCGTPHGPDAVSLAGALAADTSTPKKFEGGLAFMFETNAMLRLTPFALDRGKGMLQEEYYKCWEGLPRAKLPQ